MTDHFDPYHKWLGIPPAEQPPDLYRLLGTVRFEDDPDVIANAADQRMAHLRHFQAGPHGAESQRLLNEVAAARVVLLNAEKKASYDWELDLAQTAVEEAAIPPVVPPPLPPPIDGAAPPSLSIDDDPEEYPLPPSLTPVPPPPPAVPTPPTPVPISYSTPPDDVEGSRESLPYHPDFEPVDAMDVNPGWDLAPPQAAYESPAPSAVPLSSIGMETRQWLDNVLAELSSHGRPASPPAARPWEPRGHVPVLPVVDGSEPMPPPDAVPPDEDLAAPSWFERWEGPSMAAVSAVWSIALTALLFLLGLSVLAATPFPLPEEREWLVIGAGDDDTFDELDDLDDELLDQPLDLSTEIVGVDVQTKTEHLDLLPTEDMIPTGAPADLRTFGIRHVPRRDALAQIGALDGEGLDGRSGPMRSRLVAEGGGSGASEAAVALALQWFANHQLKDGSWSFDHTIAPSCRGQCGNPGNLRDARNGATGMALLAFLGAGQTHWTGKHKQNVRKGLDYLMAVMKLNNQGGSFHEAGGTMYSHGLATLALVEAYGMTRDRNLLQPAQAAVNYICYAQDPVGGGWRYERRQAGDTSVVGWQLAALRAAHISYLQVPPEVVKKASLFLDSVQTNSGASYGYTGPGSEPATTSVGLLCRMHLGWGKGNPALQRGIAQISEWGVATDGQMYYNYYATQIARHWEGDVWEKWNGQMHDWLVNSQVKRGHEAGSWYFRSDRHGDRGGRPYMTALATLMLEAYYRYMPIYRKATTEDDFAL